MRSIRPILRFNSKPSPGLLAFSDMAFQLRGRNRPDAERFRDFAGRLEGCRAEDLLIRIDGKHRMKHCFESSIALAKAASHMRDLNGLRENVLLALRRVSQEAAAAQNAEQALWTVTRTLPSLLGNRSADHRLGEPASAAAAFMATPDRQHHLITAPVNFRPEQYHELVAIDLGHPGIVARTRRPIFLADTGHHESFVKILQTFRAGSAMQLPMLWKGEYLGVLVCANAARGAFEELDFEAMEAFAALAAAVWLAHDGPAWLCSIDYERLPVRRAEPSR